jgi:hypothetical protein
MYIFVTIFQFFWDINQFHHILGFFDGILYLGLTIYVLCNLHSIWENPIARFFLLLLIVYITIHALGVGNFGTAIRHRSKFVVFLIILAGGIVGGLLFMRILFAAAGGAWLIYQLMGCCNKSTKYIWNLETLT